MQLSDVNFNTVRNRNEKKVVKALENLQEHNIGLASMEILDEKDWLDIYALALNQLPARYVQPGTIVVGDPVREADADQAVLEAFETVLNRPKE